MSVQDDLLAAQRCLDDLGRSLGRLEQHLGPGPELRRARIDADHLRQSVTRLRESAAAGDGTGGRPDLIAIPDTPYDSALWAGSDDLDDEGVGARDRHAP